MILNSHFPTQSIYRPYCQILKVLFLCTYKSDTIIPIIDSVIVLQQLFMPVQPIQLLGIDICVINAICRGLWTVLKDGDAIWFRHQSFADFLTENSYKLSISFSDDLMACQE